MFDRSQLCHTQAAASGWLPASPKPHHNAETSRLCFLKSCVLQVICMFT